MTKTNDIEAIVLHLEKEKKFNEDLHRINKRSHVIDGCEKTIIKIDGFIAALKAQEARVKKLELALSNVRDDIGREAMNVIWRGSSMLSHQTSFDYITEVIGDELSYDEWDEARAALNDKT